MAKTSGRSLLNIFARLAVVFVLASLFSGCVSFHDSQRRPRAWRPYKPEFPSRVNLFLNLDKKLGPATSLEVTDIEILSEDVWLPLIDRSVFIDSAKLGEQQMYLGGKPLPPARYQRIRMTFSSGQVTDANGQILPLLREPMRFEFPLEEAFTLEKGDSKTLMFVWDVEGSIQSENVFSPDFIIAAALRQLPRNMIFVSCPEIDTIFAIRADKNWVVDSFGIEGGPSYLAVEPSLSGQRLYVLTPGDEMLKVVDLSSQRVVERYPTFNDIATFMTISQDGQSAYILYRNSGYLARINLFSGQIESRVYLGAKPEFAAYLETQNLLAVSQSLGQRVLLLDPDTLEPVRSISTGSKPQGLLMAENELFIAENGDASVFVTDLENSGDVRRLMVGFGPTRLADTGNQIFVSNRFDGSISVLMPGQLSVIQDIYGLGEPGDMVFDPSFRHLYVVDDKNLGLGVIDVNSNQFLGNISLGARPLGIALIQ